MKGQCSQLGDCNNPLSPAWAQQPSEPHLFIFPFPSPTPSTEAHYEIMEKPFSIQRQLVATGYKSLICPQGDFTDRNHCRRKGLKKRGRRKGQNSPPLLPLLFQKWGSAAHVRRPLWGPGVFSRPDLAYGLVWSKTTGGRLGKEIVYQVPGEIFQMKRWLKMSQHVGRWKAVH